MGVLLGSGGSAGGSGPLIPPSAIDIRGVNVHSTPVASETFVIPWSSFDKISLIDFVPAEGLAAATYPSGPLAITLANVGAGDEGDIRIAGHAIMVISEAAGAGTNVGDPLYIQLEGSGAAAEWDWTLTKPTSGQWKHVGWIGQVIDETAGRLGVYFNLLRDLGENRGPLELFTGSFDGSTSWVRLGSFTWDRSTMKDYDRLCASWGAAGGVGGTAVMEWLGKDVKALTDYAQDSEGATPTDLTDTGGQLLGLGQIISGGIPANAAIHLAFTSLSEVWYMLTQDLDPAPFTLWVERV